jgi:uncharacterized protein YgiM (DUF1202 family)
MMLVIIVVVILLLSARWRYQAGSSHTLNNENFPLVPYFTPINANTSTATAQAKVSVISQPKATKTPTPTATSTSTPSATYTPLPTSTPETVVKFIGDSTKLRTGPGTSFQFIRTLLSNEMLSLLGRTSDNSWLYVKTSDGQEGWIKPTWVDLAGINLDSYSIQTPSSYLTVKVLGDRINLRTGPGSYYAKVVPLSYGDSLTLLGRLYDNSWLFISTADGREGWISTSFVDQNVINFYNDFHPVKTPPPTETATPVVLTDVEGHWIDIDLSEQKLYAYDGTELVASFLVSTGIDAFPTVTGKYKIYAKFLYSDMHGSDYFLPDVPYTMYYDGDFSIHGTYWHHSFGTPMSHGCINMDISDSEWLYSWSPVGTLVNIHW